ncbi:trans-aconitate 2-methyltransferase [Taklimakanibacter lacteus]|uniref:trans-aconitate 2-methyltransferase n=1 Tax=Taklimakanibacter lacteus TaxID=2268456 RepID=UPI000E6715F8
MADWSSEQYLKFTDERTRAARDLLAQVPLSAPHLVYDLGCGPGNSTELLIDCYPRARIIGLDSSSDMLAKARKTYPRAEFMDGDLATWQPDGKADLLFANAVFQWVPDHVRVLQRLLRGLPKGGVLAVQMPDNLNEPSHVAMRETALAGSWADKLKTLSRVRDLLPTPHSYYNELKPEAARIDIWHTIYNHPLDGPEGIVEWVKGTGLRPYLDPLDEAERKGFLALYLERIARAYPRASDGKVLLRFPRLFIVCIR